MGDEEDSHPDGSIYVAAGLYCNLYLMKGENIYEKDDGFIPSCGGHRPQCLW